MAFSSSEKATADAVSAERALETLRTLPKTPLSRRGMSPQELIKFAGSVPAEALDEMEAAIEAGCGRVEAHGE